MPSVPHVEPERVGYKGGSSPTETPTQYEASAASTTNKAALNINMDALAKSFVEMDYGGKMWKYDTQDGKKPLLPMYTLVNIRPLDLEQWVSSAILQEIMESLPPNYKEKLREELKKDEKDRDLDFKTFFRTMKRGATLLMYTRRASKIRTESAVHRTSTNQMMAESLLGGLLVGGMQIFQTVDEKIATMEPTDPRGAWMSSIMGRAGGIINGFSKLRG